jgi:hypothetical protein
MTGSGTLADPFIIYDVNDLQNMQLVPLAYYELGNDIDASATIGWNGGQGFLPIDQTSAGIIYPFTSPYTFDGKGFKITDLFQNWADGTPGGIFSFLAMSVKNLELKDVNITSFGSWVGGLAGQVAAGGVILDNCKISGSITTTGGGLGTIWRGGFIAGYFYSDFTGVDSPDRLLIQDCHADLIINHDWNECGGIAASVKNVDFVRCSASGSVTCPSGGFAEGGIVADAVTSTMTQCTSTMDINDPEAQYLGGLGGTISTSTSGHPTWVTMPFTASNCSWQGTLTGGPFASAYTGGLFAYIHGDEALPSYSSVNDCFAIGTISNGQQFSLGGLVGTAAGANFTRCYTIVDLININGNDNVGGLVGRLYDCATMAHCHSQGTQTGLVNRGAGLLGLVVSFSSTVIASITDCWSDVQIEPDPASWEIERAGGFVSLAGNADFQRCYARGSINNSGFMPSENIGGFCGVSSSATFTNCYARVDVSGSNNVGGFAGSYSGILTNCYSTGKVTLLNIGGAVGGLAGDDGSGSGTAVACFWDTQTSGQPTSFGGTGKTTAQMKYIHTFTGWDFRRIWGLKSSQNNGYPFFGHGRHFPIPSAPDIPLEPFRRADVY